MPAAPPRGIGISLMGILCLAATLPGSRDFRPEPKPVPPAEIPIPANLPVIPTVAKGPAVDGDISDDCWKNALTVKLAFADADTPGEPGNPTSVHAVMTATHLYFAADCVETHPDGPVFHKDATAAETSPLPADHIRVQLALGRWGRHPIIVFRAGPGGGSFTCMADYQTGVSAGDVLPSFQSAGRVLPGKWTAEIGVALSDIVLYPGDGIPKLAELNVFRFRNGDDRTKMKDERDGACIRDFFAYVQAWPRMKGTRRFNVDKPGSDDRPWQQNDAPQPMWFELTALAGGTQDVVLTTRTDTLPRQYFRKSAPLAFGLTTEEASAPRLERFADTLPAIPPDPEPAKLARTAPAGSDKAAFATLPTITPATDGFTISFAVKEPVDVVVGILGKDGTWVRHLAAGVLGPNPPAPLVANSLAQDLAWDGTDDDGRKVPPGAYTARVSLGLAPAYDGILDVHPYYDRDGNGRKGIRAIRHTEIVGLGTLEPTRDVIYEPSGADKQIVVDRRNEEVCFAGRFVYDGKTGKFLRFLKLNRPASNEFPRHGGDEVTVGANGNIWTSASNSLWRWTPEGSPLNFPATGTPVLFQMPRGHDNPNRGQAEGGPEKSFYYLHHFIHHGGQNGLISEIGADGRIRQWGRVTILLPTAGVKVDREGNLYTVTTVRPKDETLPPDFKAGISDKAKRFYSHFYGSLVKFRPTGGRILLAPSSTDWSATMDADETAPGTPAKGTNLFPCQMQGVRWVHPGASPILSRGEPIRCPCESAIRFDLDPAERIWLPDAIRSRLEILDSSGNTIAVIGKYGDPAASRGTDIQFGYPCVVAVSDTAAYVGDFYHRRAVKVKLGYAASETAGLEVK
ncbi:MAG: hypothetical protein V1809_14670 [Planctomycetota bacterium]